MRERRAVLRCQGQFRSGSTMLRAFEHLCQETVEGWHIAADEGHAAQANSGAYAQPWHWHDCVMFILPSCGAIELSHEDRHEGSWLTHDRFAVVPPNRAHKTRAGVGSSRHVALYVNGSMLSRIDGEVGSLAEFYRRTQTVVLTPRTPTIRSLQELCTGAGNGGYGSAKFTRSVAVALLIQCIAEVMSSERLPAVSKAEHGMALVADLKGYIARHADQDISLDALGERFGVSRRHLTRLFRNATGLSVGEFQQRARLRTAHDLLSETDLPVCEIAFRVGFDSGAALSHAMRRLDGRSPSDVRKSSPQLVRPRALDH